MNRKSYAYPSHTKGKSNSGTTRKSTTYRILDWICEALVIGGTIGTLSGMVLYANWRDSQQINQTPIAVIIEH